MISATPSPNATAGKVAPDRPEALSGAIRALLAYCRQHNWAGYDPYDALNSRLFSATPFKRISICRLAMTQILKRVPFNIRPLLLIPKEQNPKGIALFAATLTTLSRHGFSNEESAKSMADRLLELRSPGVDWVCWGYNFDWQTRTHLVPKGTPNIICTTFAGNALLDAWEAFGSSHYLDAASSAGHFLLNGLHRTGNEVESCFSYTPLDRSQIHNANLLGAAFLARLHAKTGESLFVKPALACARFSVSRQAPDGSWFYGETARQRWIDSFHTGYNLCALETLRSCLADESWVKTSIGTGYRYFMEHFFTAEGVVKYFHDRVYPIDIHAPAQALVTLTQLRDYSAESLPTAMRVMNWTLENMRAREGWFFFQKHPGYTMRIPFMRWGQAWMLLGMTRLLDAFPVHKS